MVLSLRKICESILCQKIKAPSCVIGLSLESDIASALLVEELQNAAEQDIAVMHQQQYPRFLRKAGSDAFWTSIKRVQKFLNIGGIILPAVRISGQMEQAKLFSGSFRKFSQCDSF